MDPRRIHAIVHGERAITAETALLLSRFFGNSAQFWSGSRVNTTWKPQKIGFPRNWRWLHPIRQCDRSDGGSGMFQFAFADADARVLNSMAKKKRI